MIDPVVKKILLSGVSVFVLYLILISIAIGFDLPKYVIAVLNAVCMSYMGLLGCIFSPLHSSKISRKHLALLVVVGLIFIALAFGLAVLKVEISVNPVLLILLGFGIMAIIYLLFWFGAKRK